MVKYFGGEKKQMGVIYKVENLINNKLYVGQTSKPRYTDRWSQHKYNAKTGKPGILYDAIRKYGIKNFRFLILEENIDINQLDNKEIYWISELNTKIPNGYNVSEGGKVPRGVPSPTKGIPRTEEVKNKIRASWTPERKLEYSKRFSGSGNPRFGKLVSQETKKKLSTAASGQNNPFYGKSHTDEAKQKISIGQDKNKKKVVMIDRQTLVPLQTFESLSAAARYLKENGYPKADDSRIGICAKEIHRYCYGHKWRWTNEI